MTSAQWVRRLLCVTIATAAVAGCARVVEGSAVRPSLAAQGNCTTVPTPMAAVEPKSSAEPLMRIPQPQNWERTTMLDTELIRWAMINPALRENDFSPSAVVTFEDVRRQSASPDDIFAAQWAGVTAMAGGTDLVTTSNRPVCGFPAQTVTYTLPGRGAIPSREGTAMAVVTTGPKRYAVVVTLQTSEPDNPTFVEDSETILDGFQILPEPNGSS